MEILIDEAQPISNAFQHCPRCGAEAASLGENPFRCSSCGFNFYFSPNAAVGAIIENEDGEVLFLIRGREPGKGKYGLPGGFVDPGESLEDSLIREVREETALKVVHAEYLCSYPNAYDYRGFTTPVMDAFFVCQVSNLDERKEQAGEVDGFVFTKPSDEAISKLAFESNRLAVEAFRSRSR